VRRIELELEVPPSHYEPGAPAGAGAQQPATTGAHAGQQGRQRTEEREAVRS
jgi:hypothetical protein